MGNMTSDNLLNTYSYDAAGRPVSIARMAIIRDAFGRAVAEPGKNIVYSPTFWKFALMNATTLIKYRDPILCRQEKVERD